MADLDLKELIAAPIIAANDAEFHNAQRFVELLDEFAFDFHDTQDGTSRELRKVDFYFDAYNPDGSVSKQFVQIPLIQFMPISGVAIDTANLRYSLQLTSDSKEENQLPRFIGKLASQNGGSEGLSGNLDIEIQLKQIDLPMGVLNLLQTSQSATQHKTVPEEKEPEPIPEWPSEFIHLNDPILEPAVLETGMIHEWHSKLDLEKDTEHYEHKIFLQASCEPSNTLKFENNEKIDITEKHEMELPFVAQPRIEKLGPSTKVKLVLNFTAMLEDGTEHRQITKIHLPRGEEK